MRSTFAPLFLLVALLGMAPAFAADSTTPAATTPAPPPASPATADAPAAAEAPVPDPFLAEMYQTCRDGASGDKGTFQRLQTAGWNLSVDGDTQTPFYQAFNGEKDFEGVGTVDLTFSLEVYPNLTEGYCSLSIATAARKIGIDDLSKVPGLKGTVRTTADGIASTWQDSAAEPTTFVQADQHLKDLYFLLDVTTLIKKPAADIPYVAPAVDDSPATD